ncbi:MAG: hypothetical protein QF357_10905 [Dehalococcoidia bacterium]|nr:hypothetical protein [Dehalococcoidia bacterium]
MKYDPGDLRLRQSKLEVTDPADKPAEHTGSSRNIESDISDATGHLTAEELNILAAKLLIAGESLGQVADELAEIGLDRSHALMIAKTVQSSLRDEDYRNRMKAVHSEYWEVVRAKQSSGAFGRLLSRVAVFAVVAFLISVVSSFCDSSS